MLTTRREFIRGSATSAGLLALGSVAPNFLTQSVAASVPLAEKDRSILVLVQLAGGNDGLNTVIPHNDDSYYRLRPKLSIKGEDALKLDDYQALHPSCRPLQQLFDQGELSILQNVGYPNPNRSHFRSMEIWETASQSNEYLSTGWMGRYFDNYCEGAPEGEAVGVNVGNELPDSFLSEGDANVFSLSGSRSRRNVSKELLLAELEKQKEHQSPNASYLQHTMMNTMVTEEAILRRISDYRSSTRYPEFQLAQDLRKVAALIASGQMTRVYYVTLSGFDTHANQAGQHARLLDQLSRALLAFQNDLKSKGLQDQVLTLTFSEFGRRPSENGSGGTDHGTAAPLFVLGSKVQAGLRGSAPKLDLEPGEDLQFSTDFRDVYATVIDKWFQADASKVMGEGTKVLDFI